jgi:hypothetical protein
MPMVTCPCCHGKKKLLIFERVDGDPEMIGAHLEMCSHCEGRGKVEAEVEENGSE